MCIRDRSATLAKVTWRQSLAAGPRLCHIRCHRTWTWELAVSCPSTIVHVGGGRSSPRNFWCFWYDKLLKQPTEHLWQTDPHCSRYSCCACKSGVGLRWKGFSVCGLLTAGRRNRMTKSLQMRACLKLNKKVLANTCFNASVWTLEL